MDDLPPQLIVEILSRLHDPADLARCRLASRTLNSLSQEVRSINFLCTLSRYLKSRSPATKDATTPFKSIFNGLVRNSRMVESISIGVEKGISGVEPDGGDVDDESDMYLMDVGFVEQWLPRVCRELRSLSISDFWFQSCWRRSDVLALISFCCHQLDKLEMKNAWLSVDRLNPMPMLTSLTLEFIRLDDEDLNKLNHCFPCLQVLNLIGVGGLKEPKINLLHLRSCQWTVSNAPQSLAVFAPNLVELKLKCSRPRSLTIEAPLLSYFHLSIEEANKFEVKEFLNLKTLLLESASLYSLVRSFPFGNAIERLTVGSLDCIGAGPVQVTRICLADLFEAFPKVTFLNLLSGAWSQIETCFIIDGFQSHIGMKSLKEIRGQLSILRIDFTLSFIYSILDECTNLSDATLLIHRGVDPSITSSFISQCMADYPRVNWTWGIWKGEREDILISGDVIEAALS